MLYDPATQKDLRSWLVRALDPICDADPGILADYVIALLSHDGPESELRKMFITQLHEFLENQSPQFVDRLFSALRTKAYIPYSTPSDRDGIPIPVDAVARPPPSPRDRVRKRSSRDFDHRPPPKAPRLHHDSTPSRYSQQQSDAANNNDRAFRHTPQHPPVGFQSVSDSPSGSEQRSHFRQSIRPMCRDYHNKGYCARGALCNYSHGEDAIAPPNSIWMNPAAFNPMMHGMPLLPMVMPFGMPQPNPDGSYDPNESRLDVANGMMPMLFPQPQLSQDTDVVMKDGNTAPSEQTPGISRPDFTSNLKSKSKPRRSSEDKTLVVEKIPTEHLQLQALTDWFSRFGSVTNVAIDSKGGKALVSFSSNDEAYKAWKSQDAVFNNRFVKVYWHHPIEGQGLRGKQALAASAGVVKDLTAKPDMPSLPSQASGTVEAPRATADAQPAPPTKSLTKAQRDALEKNIAQQKVLFSRLKSAQGEDKKQLLAEIRALSEAMEAADKLVAPKETAPIVSESTAPIDQADKLDKELDLQQAVQELTRRAQDPNEDHAAIRVEMERLIAKASSEGVRLGDEPEPQRSHPHHSYAPPFRSFRGGYRGRGAWRRGRGGAVPRNLKLDNRPRKLIVSGVDVDDDRLLEHVREWHQAAGQADLLTIEDNKDVTVQFKTRAAAEQAFISHSTLRTHIPGIKVAWPSVPVTVHDPDAVTTKDLPEPSSDIGYGDGDGDGDGGEEEQMGWGQD